MTEQWLQQHENEHKKERAIEQVIMRINFLELNKNQGSDDEVNKWLSEYYMYSDIDREGFAFLVC